jgi:hypothetical protein
MNLRSLGVGIGATVGAFLLVVSGVNAQENDEAGKNSPYAVNVMELDPSLPRGPEVHGVWIALQVDKPTLRRGEPVVVQYILANTLRDTVFVYPGSPMLDFSFDVIDPELNQADESEARREARRLEDQQGFFSGHLGAVPAGEAVTGQRRLDLMYAMQKRGQYTVTAHRRVVVPGVGVRGVQSNTVLITIVDEDVHAPAAKDAPN